MSRKLRFVEELQKNVPDFKIAFKNESLLMKIIGVILFFNPTFMTGFVTTIGKTIYFPSREQFDRRPDESTLGVLAHEYMHVRDLQRLTAPVFTMAYMFPLSLIPLLLPLFIWVWWPIVIGLILLCLAPLPAPGRMALEVRGYTMSLFAFNQLAIENEMPAATRINNLQRMVEHQNEQFTSFNYYMMWPFGVKKKLLENVNLIESGDIFKSDVIYGEVADALRASNQA